MRALKELQKTQLSIIRLQQSIGGSEPQNGGKRNSDASTAGGFDDATPASLEAELTHYKVCVSGLRIFAVDSVCANASTISGTLQETSFLLH